MADAEWLDSLSVEQARNDQIMQALRDNPEVGEAMQRLGDAICALRLLHLRLGIPESNTAGAVGYVTNSVLRTVREAQ